MFNNLKTPKGIATVGIAVVFAIAVYISAKHIYHVALHNRQTVDTAFLLPGILDIFGLFCAIKRRNTQAGVQRKLTATGMWGVLLISLWFNIEFALITNPDLVGPGLFKAILISAIPAMIIALAAEILTHVRKQAPAKPKAASTAKATTKAAEKPATARKAATPAIPRQRKATNSTALSEPSAVPAA